MAANGRSNLHVDAYMSDAHAVPGPLGRDIERLSTFFAAECASVTFDRAGRIVTICVGLEGPRLVMLDPQTLALLAEFPLPPRQPGAANPFTDFAGGGYFYLDHRDRAVIPTTHRHVWVVEQTEGPLGPGFGLTRDYDVSAVLSVDDKLFSALPDSDGRIWWASQAGVVGTIEPESGTIRTLDTGEQITNSFAVDETGGVYIVSDAALYRFDADAGGAPTVTWREQYANTGERKPGQVSPGSGTTPTLVGSKYVAITDNADPMSIVVYRRAADVTGSRIACTRAVFDPGAGATDNSLIGIGKSLIVENNHGYSGPTATTQGATTTPGLERVDITDGGGRCKAVWRSAETAPSVVPKLSLATGLVYTYTKPPDTAADAWYFTALDFRSGATVYKRLAGTGLGFNNHYAPITLGPDGTAYVGALGGLVLLRDR
jgi:streptogramin lyase